MVSEQDINDVITLIQHAPSPELIASVLVAYGYSRKSYLKPEELAVADQTENDLELQALENDAE
jgi:hypothetical protein